MGSVSRSRGFTLIEMVMVILIAGILAVGTTSFMTHSIGGYVDNARRLELANIGSLTAEKIGRELRNALPNSIRVTSGGSCLEFIPILDGSTYVDLPLTAAGNSFQAAPTGRSVAVSGRVVVYPISTDPLYSPANTGPITTADATLGTGATDVTVTLAANHQFLTGSPTQRFFIVGSPIAYCQNGTHLFRYSSYGFQSSDTSITAANLNSIGSRRLIAGELGAGSLSWNYNPASLVRNAVVRLTMSLVDPRAATEVIPIEHEVQIRNVP